jgi:hypothetical protein
MSETYARRAGGKPRSQVDRLVLKTVAIAEGSFPTALRAQQTPGGKAEVANALKTPRSTYALSVLIIHFDLLTTR